MSYYLSNPPDFTRHNEEVARVWKAHGGGKPYRVPVSIAGSIRNYIQNPALNDTGYTFADFFTNPQAQIECQLAYQKWQRYHLVCDREMGPPQGGWSLCVDFQNSYDAGWFGCPLHLDGNAVPDTVEILRENKRRLYEMECPDFLRGNLLGRAMDFYEYMHEKAPQMEYEGLPVHPPASVPGEGMDGPLDCAYKLRGAAEILTDMLTDEPYYHDLMAFITDRLIQRMKAIREWRWERNPDSPDKGQLRRPGWGFADDAIALISTETYKEFVYPYHKRIWEGFSDGSPIWIHLCGDATHHFRFLRDAFNVSGFDTGFPVDFGRLRRELGPDVTINGGPTVMLLQAGPPEAIRREVRRICDTGVMEGGKFVFIAANNLAPCTPLEHVEAFYEAAKKYGCYP